jgi:tetratricopeptide (TPR) repeat protein
VSRELDDEAARLTSELENVRREAREKLARNLALSRKLEEESGSSLPTEEAKIAQANRYHALGLQYVREKRYEEALSELEQALALNPDNPTIVNNYGFVLYKMGLYRESVTWFEKTVSLDENRPVVYVNLGDAYMNLGEEENAASCYQKYLELWPTSPRAEEIQKLLEGLEK